MLSSRNRSYLKKLGAKLRPSFQIGKAGINDNMVLQISDALEANELVKIRVLETSPTDARESSVMIAGALGAETVLVIGSIFILYRESKENKTIELS
ncbi:MAG: YhbY family RNA-binding protein [Clostridia bacterium]|nr:YhbY family RNA-binding protein [Clostridia bacterium]